MTDPKKYKKIVETIELLEGLLDDEDVELQSVWDTWVTRLAGEHALYYVNDLLEVMRGECIALSAGEDWNPKDSNILSYS